MVNNQQLQLIYKFTFNFQFAKMVGNTVLTLIVASNSSSQIKLFLGLMHGQIAEK